MDNKGFTLVEVMAAFVILMIAVEVLMMGINYSVQVSKRTVEIKKSGYTVEEALDDGTECEYGTVSLDFGGEAGTICADGKLYRRYVDENFSADFIWVDAVSVSEVSDSNAEYISEESK